MDTALLTSSDTNCLSILHIADWITLCILQCYECDDEVTLGFCRESLVLCRDILEEFWVVKFHFIASLFKCYTEHLLMFDRGRDVIRIYFDNIISPFALCFENLQSLWRIVWSNDSVTHFTLDEQCCFLVAGVTEGAEITIRTHAVGSTCTCISICKWCKFEVNIINEVDLLQCITQR